MSEQDGLIGLRFELGGGLGKVSGQIIGKAGQLYLIQKDAVDHLELFEIEDLRAARFFRSETSDAASNPATSKTDFIQPSLSKDDPEPRRRITDQLRRVAPSRE